LAWEVQQQTRQILFRPLWLFAPLKERTVERVISPQFTNDRVNILRRQVKRRRRRNRFNLE
jgi:hypothetical protein